MEGLMKVLLVGLASLIFVEPTFAQGWQADSNNFSRTINTGYIGSNTRLFPNKNQFIYKIEWSERNDNPCWFKAYSTRLRSAIEEEQHVWRHDYLGSSAVASTCSKRNNSLKTVNLNFKGPSNWAYRSVIRVVNGIAVCTNNRNSYMQEKLKGIKVTSIEITSDGRIIDDSGSIKEERTNCKTWHEVAKCPSGQAAIGMHLQRSNYNNMSVFGVKLECAPLL